MKKDTHKFVKNMFESIAPTYDLLNKVLSLKQDEFWRKELVKSINFIENISILDVAAGTADIAIEIKKYNCDCKIIAIDFALNMLKIAQKKINNLYCINKILLSAGDASRLPFKENSIDVITIAFGIRNIENKEKVLKEFYNILKPDGQILILELTSPDKFWLKKLYMLYFLKILPIIGRFVSKSLYAYSYLPFSVINFPEPETFAQIMKSANFKKIRWKRMSLGITTLFVGFK